MDQRVNATADVRKPLWSNLYIQVIAAIVIGVLVGHYYPDFGAGLKPLGDGFIKLIKMLIAPDHLLHRRARHRQHAGSEASWPRRREGVDLFRGRDDIALVIGMVIANTFRRAMA